MPHKIWQRNFKNTLGTPWSIMSLTMNLATKWSTPIAQHIHSDYYNCSICVGIWDLFMGITPIKYMFTNLWFYGGLIIQKKTHWIEINKRVTIMCLASSELVLFWQKFTSHKIVTFVATWSLEQLFSFRFFHKSENQPIMFRFLLPLQSCHFLLSVTAFGEIEGQF